MERSFRHPRGMYSAREAGPRFTGPDMPHENNWAGGPFPPWRQVSQDPRWGPPNPHWGHPKPQWNHLNSSSSQDHWKSQHCPAPQWDQYHPEWSSRGSGFDNGNFLHRGTGSYRRRSCGRFYGKRPGRFFKGRGSSHSSARVLVKMQQIKKENDFELKKDESAIPKEAKQTQEDSENSVKNTDPPQVSQEASKAITSPSQFNFCLSSDSTHPTCNPAKTEDTDLISHTDSKAIISPSQFSFRLPPDYFTSPLCSPAKTEDTELVKLGIGFKTEDSHQVACCTQTATSELPATLENLELKKEDKKTELDKLKGTQATEAQPSQAAFLASAEAPMEGQTPSNAAGSFHLVLKEEPVLATETHRSVIASPVSGKAFTEKQALSETMKDPHPVVKEKPDTEVHSCQAASLAASDEAPIRKQVPSKVTESVHPMVKEEPMSVPETKQDVNITSSTDPSSVTELSAPSCVIEPSASLETREGLLSLGKEEDELLESSEPTDHFNHLDSPPAAEITFISDTTDEGKEDLELMPFPIPGKLIPGVAGPMWQGGYMGQYTVVMRRKGTKSFVSGAPPTKEVGEAQTGDSHEDTECSQACDAIASGSSVLPVIPSDVQSVPVLVSGKETEQPYFWESKSSFHGQNFNWNDVGKGWAPEDYQEPSWGVDKAGNSGDVSEPEMNLVPFHSSFHSHCSSDRSPDTERMLEYRSSSPKCHHKSDSRHSGTQRTTKLLRPPRRQGHHSRSPQRQKEHLRFPMRRDRSCSWDSSGSSGEQEITRTYYCCKCHCKCHNPSQERFQERELPHAYSTYKMHHYNPCKETSISSRRSHSYSPENSMMNSKKRKKKSTPHEETKKGRSTSVKETKSSKMEVKRKDGETKASKTRKKKSTHHEETKKGRSTSVRQTKSSKVTMNSGKILAPTNHDAALAVETSIPAETTEHSQSANTDVYESVQLAPSSEDTDFPHQPCAGKETGTSIPPEIVEDPRSVAVLTRRNQIEQDYLQVILNFAVVATMLLQKEPCMEQALEVALRANMRSVGDYYESMLKNYIDNYDLSETH